MFVRGTQLSSSSLQSLPLRRLGSPCHCRATKQPSACQGPLTMAGILLRWCWKVGTTTIPPPSTYDVVMRARLRVHRRVVDGRTEPAPTCPGRFAARGACQASGTRSATPTNKLLPSSQNTPSLSTHPPSRRAFGTPVHKRGRSHKRNRRATMGTGARTRRDAVTPCCLLSQYQGITPMVYSDAWSPRETWSRSLSSRGCKQSPAIKTPPPSPVTPIIPQS